MTQKYEKCIARFNDDVIAKTEENLSQGKKLNPNIVDRFNRLMKGNTWKNFIQSDLRTIPKSVYERYDHNEAQMVSDHVAMSTRNNDSQMEEPQAGEDIAIPDDEYLNDLGMFDEPKDDTKEGALDILNQLRELEK